MLVHHYTIRMNDTDAAGRIYFADQFRIAHESFEAFLSDIGHDFARFLNELPFMIPIVHAKGDYKAPLFVGDRLRIELTVGKLGRSSFTLNYRITRHPDHQLVGLVSIVHATIDKETNRPCPVPDRMQRILRRLGEPEGSVGYSKY